MLHASFLLQKRLQFRLVAAVALCLTACVGNSKSASHEETNVPFAVSGAHPTFPDDANATVNIPVGACASRINVFTAKVWMPTVGVDCLACHVRHGIAAQAGARFVLAHPSESGYSATNMAAFSAMAAIDANGVSLLLAKATNTVTH